MTVGKATHHDITSLAVEDGHKKYSCGRGKPPSGHNRYGK
jgi:hypothetical protein